jgi:hypothetical protein
MADLGEITARLTADATSFTTGMGQASTAVEHFQNSASSATTGTRTFYEGVEQAGIFATGSERGIRRMEFALGSLAASSLDVSHPIGQLAEGLLLFGGGSALTVGVLAGIAGIAAAIKLLGDNSDFAATSVKKIEEQVKALAKALPETKMADHAAMVENLAKQTKELEGQLFLAHTRVVELSNLFGEHAARTEDARKAYVALVDEVRKVHAAMAELAQPGMMSAVEAVTGFVRTAASSVVMGGRVQGGRGNVGMFVPPEDNIISGMAQTNIGTTGAGQVADDVMDKAEKRFRERAAAIGLNTMRELIQGLINGTNDFGKLLESAVLELIEARLIGPIHKLLQIASPSGAGMFIGQMLAEGIGVGMRTVSLGPMALNMNLNVQKSGNLSPFDTARDADWQRAYRESALVAHQQGFRLPGQT